LLVAPLSFPARPLCLLGSLLLSLVAFISPVSGLELADTERAETIFVAPFTSVAFIEAAKIEAARLQVEEERETGIYLDKKREKIWATRDNGRDIDWVSAFDYCENLSLAGFEDWRLPTLEELQSIMKPMSNRQYATPEEINLTSCCPWSSTPNTRTSAWNFNFKFKKAFSGSMTHTYDHRALCVRAQTEADDWPIDEKGK